MNWEIPWYCWSLMPVSLVVLHVLRAVYQDPPRSTITSTAPTWRPRGKSSARVWCTCPGNAAADFWRFCLVASHLRSLRGAAWLPILLWNNNHPPCWLKKTVISRHTPRTNRSNPKGPKARHAHIKSHKRARLHHVQVINRGLKSPIYSVHFFCCLGSVLWQTFLVNHFFLKYHSTISTASTTSYGANKQCGFQLSQIKILT